MLADCGRGSMFIGWAGRPTAARPPPSTCTRTSSEDLPSSSQMYRILPKNLLHVVRYGSYGVSGDNRRRPCDTNSVRLFTRKQSFPSSISNTNEVAEPHHTIRVTPDSEVAALPPKAHSHTPYKPYPGNALLNFVSNVFSPSSITEKHALPSSVESKAVMCLGISGNGYMDNKTLCQKNKIEEIPSWWGRPPLYCADTTTYALRGTASFARLWICLQASQY